MCKYLEQRPAWKEFDKEILFSFFQRKCFFLWQNNGYLFVFLGFFFTASFFNLSVAFLSCFSVVFSWFPFSLSLASCILSFSLYFFVFLSLSLSCFTPLHFLSPAFSLCVFFLSLLSISSSLPFLIHLFLFFSLD